MVSFLLSFLLSLFFLVTFLLIVRVIFLVTFLLIVLLIVIVTFLLIYARVPYPLYDHFQVQCPTNTIHLAHRLLTIFHTCITTIGYSAYVVDNVTVAVRDLYTGKDRPHEKWSIVLLLVWLAIGSVLWYYMEDEWTAIRAVHACLASLSTAGLQVRHLHSLSPHLNLHLDIHTRSHLT